MRSQSYTFRLKKFGADASLGRHPFSILNDDHMDWSFISGYRLLAFDSPVDGAGLFSVELEECSEAVNRLSRFINECAAKQIEMPEINGEFDVHRFLAKNVIYPLTGYCCLSSSNNKKAKDKKPSLYGDVKVKGTGLGDGLYTWHGYLDMISKITVENDHCGATSVAVAQPSLNGSLSSEEGCEVKPQNGTKKISHSIIF